MTSAKKNPTQAQKANLTDLRLKSLKPREKPYEVMDTVVSGFGVRVMPGGKKTFIIRKRFSSNNPTRRAIGNYDTMRLADAREKAREWLALVSKGVDPSAEEERQRRATRDAERRRKVETFGNALNEYLKRKSNLKSVPTIKRELSRECASWMDRALADISTRDVKELIEAIRDSGRKAQAHAIFGRLRAFLNWAADSGDFGIEQSPCWKLKPSVLIGPKSVRSRVLKDHEIVAYVRAASKLSYPFKEFFELLLLTALRRNEVAKARWREINIGARLWVIPDQRMKGKAAHSVPLTPEIYSLLERLPRFNGGDFLLSTKSGEKPVSGFSKAKARLDKFMREDIAAQGLTFEDFDIHDIRRTCRTRFSALPVEDIVRELLLAHARPGLHKVYDLHAYEKEKAHALELWHEKLTHIIGRKLVL